MVFTHMKCRLFILFVFGACILALLPYRLIASSPYTDDAYSWPVIDTLVSSEPRYDRNAREFIFLEDTVQHPDTVRMRIIEK